MNIKYHKNFLKRFEKLSQKTKEKIKQVILTFSEDPFANELKNHPLKGKQKDKRAISVTGDIRIIFKEYHNYTLVIMIDVGTHNQVY